MLSSGSAGRRWALSSPPSGENPAVGVLRKLSAPATSWIGAVGGLGSHSLTRLLRTSVKTLPALPHSDWRYDHGCDFVSGCDVDGPIARLPPTGWFYGGNRLQLRVASTPLQALRSVRVSHNINGLTFGLGCRCFLAGVPLLPSPFCTLPECEVGFLLAAFATAEVPTHGPASCWAVGVSWPPWTL
jgi:hypothetical protein